MPKKILILSGSIGTGHTRAAQAVEKALNILDPSADVRHEDALNFANAAFRTIYQQAYIQSVNKAPEILGWIYNQSERVWPENTYGLAFERWNALPLVKLLRDYAPDIVISTHTLPVDMTSWLICKKAINTQHAIIVTDYETNPLWRAEHYSRYFAASEEVKRELMYLGYKEDLITVSGIPIDPVFAQKKDRNQMRTKHNLSKDKTIILTSAGGLGMGPIDSILQALIRLEENVQIIAICGANEELKANLENSLSDYLEGGSEAKLKILGYTNEMDELMSAADLALGKPGGLTSSEALAKGLVFVIVNPIPGQEERNSDHLLEHGAAIRCNSLGVLSYKLNSLLSDKERFHAMSQKALQCAKPNSASIIGAEILKMIQTPVECATHPDNHSCRKLF
ncbi:MAG: hypothetical protein K2X77_30410 [Candidatus Obscuribacterales bacterium]|nr:hypothetical protein [Candidatus Obscuribacterales bacterium]